MRRQMVTTMYNNNNYYSFIHSFSIFCLFILFFIFLTILSHCNILLGLLLLVPRKFRVLFPLVVISFI